MSWLERLRPASFRGVPFRVDDHEGEGGRRVHLHEFTKRDLGFAEDLGLANPAFSIRAYVVGPDYDVDRDNLIDACNAEGPGTLIHPYYGEVLVACPQVRWRESRREGRIAYFELKFVRTSEESAYPVATTDTAATVTDQAAISIADAKSVFDDVFVLAGVPDALATTAEQFLTDLADMVDTLPVLTLGGEVVQQAVNLAELAERVVALPSSIVGGVTGVSDAIISTLGAYFDAATDPIVSESGLAQVVAFTAARTIPTGDGVVAATASRNEQALIQVVEQVAIANRAANAARRTFTSYDEAADLRHILVADIQAASTRAGDTGHDVAFLSLRSLKQKVADDLTSRGAGLARLSAYEFADNAPAVAVAQRLYQDASRSQDLVNRNDAGHPLFLPATGVALSS